MSSSVSQAVRSASDLLKPLAQKFNLSLTSFGKAVTDPNLPTYGSLVLSDPWNTELEPAPISPYRDSPAFRVLSGTIKGAYNAHRGLEGDNNILVYPSYLFGNTGKVSTSAPSPHLGVVTELLMQTLSTIGSCRRIFTDTTTMTSTRGTDSVGSIPSMKVRCLPRLLPVRSSQRSGRYSR